MDIDPLKILLFLLVFAGIWAVSELALTLRKTRTTLDEVSHSATEAIDQATPIIAKLDGVVDELQPALREVTPMVDQANTLLGELNTGMGSLNGILTDVNSATRGVAGVGESATRIVNTATNAAVGVVSKVASFGGITIPEGQQLIGKGKGAHEAAEDGGAQAAEAKADEAPQAAHTYVTYKPVTGEHDERAE